MRGSPAAEQPFSLGRSLAAQDPLLDVYLALFNAGLAQALGARAGSAEAAAADGELGRVRNRLALLQASGSPSSRLADLARRFELEALECQLVALLVLDSIDLQLGALLDRACGLSERRGLSAVAMASLLDAYPENPIGFLQYLRSCLPARYGWVVEVDGSPEPGASPLTAHFAATPALVEYLLDLTDLSRRLDGLARWVPPDSVHRLPDLLDPGLARAVARLGHLAPPLRDGDPCAGRWVFVSGAPGSGAPLLARSAVSAANVAALEVFTERLVEGGHEPALELVCEAQLRNLVLLVPAADYLLERRDWLLRHVARRAAALGVGVVATCEQPEGLLRALAPHLLYHMDLGSLGATNRQTLLRRGLEGRWGPAALASGDGQELHRVAQEVQVGPEQLGSALACLPEDAPLPGPADLRRVLEAHQEMARIEDRDVRLQRPEAVQGFDTLVLPRDTARKILQVFHVCRQRTRLLDDWGFGDSPFYDRSLVVLFYGDPGTGKSHTAKLIAANLERPLIRLSIPTVVSKWVGESERNISRIFHTAQERQAVLIIDEADALFGSRVEVKSSSDRYANMITNHLLEEIERFRGVIFLTTNRIRDMDQAFARRILFKIEFPFPERPERARLWRLLLPAGVPLAADVDFEALAELDLTGGLIRNSIFLAACRAAERRGAPRPVRMRDLVMTAVDQCRTAGHLPPRHFVEEFDLHAEDHPDDRDEPDEAANAVDPDDPGPLDEADTVERSPGAVDDEDDEYGDEDDEYGDEDDEYEDDEYEDDQQAGIRDVGFGVGDLEEG